MRLRTLALASCVLAAGCAVEDGPTLLTDVEIFILGDLERDVEGDPSPDASPMDPGNDTSPTDTGQDVTDITDAMDVADARDIIDLGDADAIPIRDVADIDGVLDGVDLPDLADAGDATDLADAADARDTLDAADTADARDAADTVDAADAQVTDTATDPGEVQETCVDLTFGECADPRHTCFCCPIGGPAQHCLCSTSCNSDAHCTDPARPVCHEASPSAQGFCGPADFFCCWECT